MTPQVKAKVLAAAAAQRLPSGETRPGFAARAVEREARRQVERSSASAPRVIAAG